MKVFGLINRLNGLDHLPYWPEAPCNSITASEGKFVMAAINIIFVDLFQICLPVYLNCKKLWKRV